jgi:hypothetical protein
MNINSILTKKNSGEGGFLSIRNYDYDYEDNDIDDRAEPSPKE